MINTIKTHAIVIAIALSLVLNLIIGVTAYKYFTAVRSAITDIANVLGVAGIVEQGQNGTININKVVRVKDVEAAAAIQ